MARPKSANRAPSRGRAPRAAESATALRPSPVSWWPYTLLVGLIAVVYANSLSGVFLFDDFGSVVRNVQIRDLSNWHAIWVPPADTPVAGRPLAHLSLALNYAVGGLNVGGYHVVNIALHALCASLLFALVSWTLTQCSGFERLRPSATIIALAVAAVWAVHPLNSEVVDYISQRTESLMAVCYLGALYGSARAWRSAHEARWRLMAVVLCCLGAFCKESIVTAPIAVVLYDRAFIMTTFAEAFRARWRLYAGLSLTWMALALGLAVHGQTANSLYSTAPTSSWLYLLNQSRIIPHYLWRCVWPRDLVLFYGWARPYSLAEVWPWTLGVSLAVAASIVLYLRRPRVGFVWVWFFLTLGPTSSLIPLGTEVGAERRMYLPLAGLLAGAVVGLAEVVRPAAARRIVGGVAVVACVALSVATMARNREYDSSLGMAETIATRWPSPAADYLLGTELASAGRHDEAIAHLSAAVDSDPPAGYYLGAELFKAGRYDDAIARLQTLIAREPRLPIVRPSEVMIARAYELKGDWPGAVAACERILASWPTDPDAHGLLADALSAERNYTAAIPHYRTFLEAQPANSVAWNALALALLQTNQRGEAIQAFQHGVEARPTDVRLRENLARVLLDDGRASDAEQAAAQAEALAPTDPVAHEVRGRALAALGRIGEARTELTRALAIDPSYGPAAEALRELGIRRPPSPEAR